MNALLKLWRSPHSRFGEIPYDLDDGEDETMTAVNAYTDEELREIAACGFNGIWVHGLLRNIVPSSVFAEFGRRSVEHLTAMRTLIERAERHGIKVYLYMQPPRAIPTHSDFWRHHADAGGSLEAWDKLPVRSLCTSDPQVRNFLRESSETLVKNLPGLGGLIMITASEYPSHCWARSGDVLDAAGKANGYRVTTCPRCAQRSPVDVVSEIIHLVRDGVKAARPEVEVIAWNWSWNAYEADPSSEIIRRLPKDVILMADFERGGRKMILGKERIIDEYSLSYSGPSERFQGAAACARENGMRVMTKLQLGTTHELATVPNLPLLGNLYDKADYVKSQGLSGFVGCWNFGNRRTANTAGFNYFLSQESPTDKHRALLSFARSYFPGCDANKVVEAWELFSRAMDSYPFSIPFVYSSPINYVVAYPMRPGPLTDERPCGPSWYAVEDRGECLEASLGTYSVDEIIEGFSLLSEGWSRGLEVLLDGLAACESRHAEEERSTARVCLHVFRSMKNTYRNWKLRLAWDEQSSAIYAEIARDEHDNLCELLPVLESDPRQGFHGEGFTYFFNASSVSDKIRSLNNQLK